MSKFKVIFDGEEQDVVRKRKCKDTISLTINTLARHWPTTSFPCVTNVIPMCTVGKWTFSSSEEKGAM